jgi:uncharacterized membrane protein required for colicin V production
METKNILLSKRMWGLAFIVAALLGYDIPDEYREQLPNLITDTVNSVIGLIGVIVSLYGSMKAEKKLTVLPKSAGLPWRKGL